MKIKQKILYHYNGNNNIYSKTTFAKIDPLEFKINKVIKFLVPAKATEIKPPRHGKNKAALFHEKEQQWEVVADYRGKIYYDKNTGKKIIPKLGLDIRDLKTTNIAPTILEKKGYKRVYNDLTPLGIWEYQVENINQIKEVLLDKVIKIAAKEKVVFFKKFEIKASKTNLDNLYFLQKNMELENIKKDDITFDEYPGDIFKITIEEIDILINKIISVQRQNQKWKIAQLKIIKTCSKAEDLEKLNEEINKKR